MRTVALLLLVTALLFVATSPARSCFGPKLYFGVGAGAEAELVQAVVVLYLKEKTGVETVRVELEGKDPRIELAEERLDLALATGPDGAALLQVPGFPALLAGRRPQQELQFTTVVPALRKLAGLLTAEALRQPLVEVRGGASPAAVARTFLRKKGWL